MAYTAPNIDAVAIEFEPYTVPADLTAIEIGFGDATPEPIDPDWREATPYQKVSGAWVTKAGRRKVGGVWRTGKWYRCVNPDTVAPAVAGTTLTLIETTETGFTISFNKGTDNRTAAEDLVYKLYVSDIPLDTLSAIDNDGTLADSGTDVNQLSATNLVIGETYYYNVTCEDLAGNRELYTGSFITLLVEGIESFDIIDDNFFILSGNSRQIQFEIFTIGETSEEITWESSDTDILTVTSGGVVTGVSQGTVTLTGTPTAQSALAQSILIGVDTFDFGPYSQIRTFTTINE